MKNLIVLLVAFISITAFSQEITREKSKFYLNGNQISTREAKELIKQNAQAYTYFKEAKSKEGLGGLILGAGIGLGVANVVNAATSDIDFPSTTTYVALGAMAISIPILSGRTKKIDKALEIYNNGLKATGETQFEYQIVANHNGCGLRIFF